MRTEWEEGATADLRLTVTPSGPNTVATVTVFGPDGRVEPNPEAKPLDDTHAEWGAPLVLTDPGVWRVAWSVTGTGAGVSTYYLRVRPAPAGSDDGTAYATSADLARWINDAPPEEAALLLARATARVDELLLTAVYHVDDRGRATHPAVAKAIVDATCAQAAWFGETGDDTASGYIERHGDVKIGNVQVSGIAAMRADGADPRFAPDTVRILAAAGLLSGRVWVPL